MLSLVEKHGHTSTSPEATQKAEWHLTSYRYVAVDQLWSAGKIRLPENNFRGLLLTNPLSGISLHTSCLFSAALNYHWPQWRDFTGLFVCKWGATLFFEWLQEKCWCGRVFQPNSTKLSGPLVGMWGQVKLIFHVPVSTARDSVRVWNLSGFR